jgi:hypothetical protein
MAQLLVHCADPNNLKALEEAIHESAGRCNVTYYNQAEAMMEAGSAKSLHDASKQIAAQTGESPKVVENRVYRGKQKKVPQGEEHPKPKLVVAHDDQQLTTEKPVKAKPPAKKNPRQSKNYKTKADLWKDLGKANTLARLLLGTLPPLVPHLKDYVDGGLKPGPELKVTINDVLDKLEVLSDLYRHNELYREEQLVRERG